MTRKQVENLDRTTWECMSCQMIEANPQRKANEKEAESIYKIGKTKLKSIKILQFNIDVIQSKLEELKKIIKKEDI